MQLFHFTCCSKMQLHASFLHSTDFGTDLGQMQSSLMGEGQVNILQLPRALPKLWKQALVVSSSEENGKSTKKSNVSLTS